CGGRKPREPATAVALRDGVSPKELAGRGSDVFFPQPVQHDSECYTPVHPVPERNGMASPYSLHELEAALDKVNSRSAPGPYNITVGQICNLPTALKETALAEINQNMGEEAQARREDFARRRLLFFSDVFWASGTLFWTNDRTWALASDQSDLARVPPPPEVGVMKPPGQVPKSKTPQATATRLARSSSARCRSGRELSRAASQEVVLGLGTGDSYPVRGRTCPSTVVEGGFR
ncbi:hypothetical protein HPB47_028101, partial [Ixodes persulcatus]